MRPADIAKAIACPILDTTVLVALLSFYLAMQLILWILSLGRYFVVSAMIITAFTLPGLCLYLISLLEARARGRKPGPPGIEHLQWFGSSWSLLQVLYFVGLGYAIYRLAGVGEKAGIVITLSLVAALLPASLATLAVTHSAAESLHPVTIARIIRRSGWSYWIATAYILLASWFVWTLRSSSLTGWLIELITLYLLFAFYALIGTIMQPQHLHDEVDIHEPLGPDEAAITADLAALRTGVLDHAYAIVSRGYRDGGLSHIHESMEDDPEPDSAWPWYFENMMLWEDKMAALVFGQQYLSRLLHDGEFHAATKLIMRCRYESESFKPLAEDREQAIAAAEYCGNEELAKLL